MNIDLTKLITAQAKAALVTAAAAEAKADKARAYLASTDWMVLRSLEGAKALPADVRAARAAARLAAGR